MGGYQAPVELVEAPQHVRPAIVTGHLIGLEENGQHAAGGLRDHLPVVLPSRAGT